MPDTATLTSQLDAALSNLPAIAILRASTTRHLIAAADTLAGEGFRVLEVPLTTPGATDAIAAARARFGRDVLIGAGTVLDTTDAERALACGAQLLVSPGLCLDVVAAAHAADVPALPGAFTTTEVLAAQHAGASLVKLFPANVVGPDYLTALRQPLPFLRAVPTGGVTLADAGAWLAAGAAALGLGSPLVADTLESGAMDELLTSGRDWVREIRACR